MSSHVPRLTQFLAASVLSIHTAITRLLLAIPAEHTLPIAVVTDSLSQPILSLFGFASDVPFHCRA
jgi:hypothetical protein